MDCGEASVPWENSRRPRRRAAAAAPPVRSICVHPISVFFLFLFEEFIFFLSFNKFVFYTNPNPFGRCLQTLSMDKVEVEFYNLKSFWNVFTNSFNG